MRYDWKDGIQYEEFSKKFYTEIELRFFGAVELYAPCKKIPFYWSIHFHSLKTRDVLEIGGRWQRKPCAAPCGACQVFHRNRPH